MSVCRVAVLDGVRRGGRTDAEDVVSNPVTARLQPDDRVITPTDEVAYVVEGPDKDGAVVLRYAQPLSQDWRFLTLRVSFLALWADGRPRPRPVRRGFDGCA